MNNDTNITIDSIEPVGEIETRVSQLREIAIFDRGFVYFETSEEDRETIHEIIDAFLEEIVFHLKEVSVRTGRDLDELHKEMKEIVSIALYELLRNGTKAVLKRYVENSLVNLNKIPSEELVVKELQKLYRDEKARLDILKLLNDTNRKLSVTFSHNRDFLCIRVLNPFRIDLDTCRKLEKRIDALYTKQPESIGEYMLSMMENDGGCDGGVPTEGAGLGLAQCVISLLSLMGRQKSAGGGYFHHLKIIPYKQSDMTQAVLLFPWSGIKAKG